MTSSLHARDAHRVLRILCKHFGKFPGQTLPVRWLALEWESGTGLPDAQPARWGTDQRPFAQTDLQNALDYAVHSGWLIRRRASDEPLIELTQTGYKWQADREAINISGKNTPRDLLKLLKRRSST
jgi:hypothetical protein